MNDMALHSIELCAGVGMLGEGIRAGFELLGFQHRTICYVEREAFAASQLVTLMEAGVLDSAPIWSDMLTFNGTEWRGKVDCVIAGFPCQDLSVAGRRAGLDGQRSGLFFRVCEIADDCGAQLLILENVRGITSATASVVDEEEGDLEERACSRVMGELADRGWDSEWIHVSASDVGASHGRERWFCLAWRQLADPQGNRDGKLPRDELAGRTETESASTELGNSRLQYQQLQQREIRSESQRANISMANPSIKGQQITRPSDQRELPEEGGAGIHDRPEHSCDSVADTSEPGCEGSKQRETLQGNGNGQEAHGPVSEFCSALGLFAPGPTDERWPGIIERYPYLAPAIESGVCGMVDGLALVVDESKAHQLRAIGNGVVPLSAAAALIVLVHRSRK